MRSQSALLAGIVRGRMPAIKPNAPRKSFSFKKDAEPKPCWICYAPMHPEGKSWACRQHGTLEAQEARRRQNRPAAAAPAAPTKRPWGLSDEIWAARKGRLNERQLEVLSALRDGIRPKQLGEQLGLNVTTIAFHRKRGLKAMGL